MPRLGRMRRFAVVLGERSKLVCSLGKRRFGKRCKCVGGLHERSIQHGGPRELRSSLHERRGSKSRSSLTCSLLHWRPGSHGNRPC